MGVWGGRAVSDRVLRLLAIASTLALVAGLAGTLAFGLAAGDSVRDSVVPLGATAIWGGVGAILAFVRPRNEVGWLLLAIGVTLSASGAAGAYVNWSEARNTELSAAALAAWFGSQAWIIVIAFLIPRFLLVFPDGRLPSRRWRVVAVAQYLMLAGLTVGALEPGPLPDHDYRRYDNPLGIGALDWLGRIPEWGNVIGLPILLLATVGAAISLIVRFHNSRGAERQQLKFMALVVGVAATTWFVAALMPYGAVYGVVQFIAIIGLVFAPLAVLVAVLRYRLYDIDAVISKTLVYAALSLVLGAAYIGLVLAGQAVFSTFAGGSNLAIAVSTLVVAALFLPVRSRVQRLVDRRFFRRRYDAQQTLEAFANRLREEVDLGELVADLRVVVAETMQPQSVTVWRRGQT
jgi:hypothetical protein